MRLKIVIWLLSIIAASCGYLYMHDNQEKGEIVAILQTVEHPALNFTRRGIKDHLASCCRHVHVVYENAHGDSNLGIQIARKFVQDKPKVIATIGTLASQVFLKIGDIPIVFSSVTDPVAAGLVKDLKHTGTHFSGVSNMIEMSPQLEFFQAIYPELQTIGVVYNAGEVNSVKLISMIKSAASKLGLEIHESSARSGSDIIVAAQQLAKEVDAIFVTNDNTALSALGGIVKAADAANIPVFCSDNDTIGEGVLATFGPNQYDIGLQTGKMIEQILHGEHVTNLPVNFPHKIEKKIDISVANRLNISIPSHFLEEVDEVIGQ